MEIRDKRVYYFEFVAGQNIETGCFAITPNKSLLCIPSGFKTAYARGADGDYATALFFCVLNSINRALRNGITLGMNLMIARIIFFNDAEGIKSYF